MSPSKPHGVLTHLLAVILIGPVMAGCMGNDKGSDAAIGPKPGEPVGSLGLEKMYVASDCERVYSFTVVPDEWAAPFLPDGFRGRGMIAPETGVSLHWIDCENLQFGTNISRDLQILEVSIWVVEAMDGGDGDQTQLTIESYVSDASFVKWLERFHQPVMQASVEVLDEPVAGDLVMRSWSVQSEAGSFRVSLPWPADFGQDGEISTRVWYTGEPPKPALLTGLRALPTTMVKASILVEMTGDSKARAILQGAGSWAFDPSYYQSPRLQIDFGGVGP